MSRVVTLPYPLPVIKNAPRADSAHFQSWADYRKWRIWLSEHRLILDIIIHSTQGLNSLRTLTVEPGSKKSAHALANRDGSRNNLVDLNDIAWHAGTCIPGISNIGTLGLEIENNSRTDPPRRVQDYPQAQMITAGYTLAEWMFSYGIGWPHVHRHGDVATPRGRRSDPDNFDWPMLVAITNQWLTFFHDLPRELHGAYIL